MIRFPHILCCVVLLVHLLGCCEAQQTPISSQSLIETYSESNEGLQKLFVDIMTAAHSNDVLREKILINSLIMPPESNWFTVEFGPAFGPRLSAAYQRMDPNLADQIRVVLEANRERGLITPKIFKYDDPAKTNSPIDSYLNCMDTISPLYETAFNGNRPAAQIGPDPNASGRTRQIAGDLRGYYVYVAGGFRYVPADILMMLPKQRPLRIQLDWDIISLKATHRVIWVYPQEAFSQHITDKVHIHLVLDIQGKIKEIAVVQGPVILAGPLLDALKQWTFEPTTLDGDPVEVEVNFESGIHWASH